MKVCIRADATPVIGSGHVMRCLALARQLGGLGADVTFMCRAVGPGVAEQIRQSGLTLIALPDGRALADNGPYFHSPWLGVAQEDDADAVCAALTGGRTDWMIVDHYGIGAPWETRVARHVDRLAVIDDLADRPHACDLLIDSNLSLAGSGRYGGRVGAGTVCLEGPSFVMLRPEFVAAARQLRPVPDVARRILVSFGGFDAGNHTGHALDALDLLAEPVAVDIIVGAGHPALEDILARAAAHPSWTVHQQTPRVAELMLSADLAIGAGGQMTYERACLGLPAIAICMAENQREQLEAAGRAGFLMTFPIDRPASELARAVDKVMHDKPFRQRMREAGQDAVDGKGVKRILKHLLALTPTSLRPAAPRDMDMIRDWRNHDITRAVSGSSAVVDADTHRAWFASKLADPGCVMLIAEKAGLACGVVRFDGRGGVARVSIFLAPQVLGYGLGQTILQLAESHLRTALPEVHALEASVAAGNTASQALFQSSGYLLQDGLWRKPLPVADG